ncbi:oxygenase MpaB family protein [Candidatus Poriferisocius sp.]|uniref:oxygenase MpaB family protein n=1 Tax=Candidatus Poriferisocius sp. TaxID=3101276 RepID=UPI003B029533
MIGDPLADAAIEALSSMKQSASEEGRLIAAYMNKTDGENLPDAPPEVEALFDHASTLPDWLELSALAPGVHMFHRNLKMVLGGMIAGTLVEGFSTNISKSFFITGRLRDQGVRRLQQNNRHMTEIFFPNGLERFGDGWKLSVRIRLIHAQIRRLLTESEEWDADAWGTPLSAAHIGFAITAFSARLLKHMRNLGATYSDEEAASFMTVWRYSGHLMGIPESILFRDEAEALKLFEVGVMSEPKPDFHSIAMANSLVNSAPPVVGVDGRDEQRKLAQYVYRVSRALIGNTLADQLNYPKQVSFGVLSWQRAHSRYYKIMSRILPKHARMNSFNDFMTLMSGSRFDEQGIPYQMPNHVYAEESDKW